MNSPDSLRGGDDDTYERRKLGKGRVSLLRVELDYTGEWLTVSVNLKKVRHAR